MMSFIPGSNNTRDPTTCTSSERLFESISLVLSEQRDSCLLSKQTRKSGIFERHIFPIHVIGSCLDCMKGAIIIVISIEQLRNVWDALHFNIQAMS